MSFRAVKKIILIFALSVIALALLLAGAGAVTWYTVKDKPVQELTSVVIDPAGVALGGTVTVYSTYKVPWGRRSPAVEITAVPGLLQLGEPEFKAVKRRWGWNELRVSVKLKTFRTGILAGAKMAVNFDAPRGESFAYGIPSCRVDEISIAAPELQVAGAIEQVPLTRRERGLLYGVIALAAVIAVLLIVLFKRRKRAYVIPPWTLALQDIAELHHELRGGNLNLETGLARLTDIVRVYLEKRFALHTTRQTTPEFMHELSRGGGPLPERHRPFLSEFMTSADLVKFAKMPPDAHMLGGAIEKAEILVNETRPADEPGGRK